ncbi:MAG: WD40 repeat domain-containing protein [Chloroflexota bacterium]|nr:WD40 repeat domain-containing protein [Chloroflexota bacterium]
MRRLLIIGLILVIAIQLHAQTEVTPREVLRLGRGEAEALDWHPSANILAVASSTGVWLYDAHLADLAYLAETGAVQRLAWSPDGDRLATYHPDGTLRVWSVTLNPYSVTSVQSWTFTPERDDFFFLEWAPDSRRLATAFAARVQVFDIAQDALIIAVPDAAPPIAWHPDGTQIAAVANLGASIGEQVRVWDASDGAIVTTYTTANADLYWSDIAWSPDGDRLAAVTAVPAALFAWNTATGAVLTPPNDLNADMGMYTGLWWINGGAQVITADRAVYNTHLSLTMWDTVTWTSDEPVYIGPDVRAVAKRPAVSEWAVLTWDGQSAVHGLDTQKALHTRLAHPPSARLLMWSPDGRSLAADTPTGAVVVLWDTASAVHSQSRAAFNPFPGWRVDALRWSADRRWLSGVISIPEITAPGAYPTAIIARWDGRTGKYSDILHETQGYFAWDGSGDNYTEYTWSEDFSRVVERRLGEKHITVYTVSTSASGAVAPDHAIATIPMIDRLAIVEWSPDNTMLAIVTRDQMRETSAWVYNAQTGALIHRLHPTFPTTLYDLSWSPDSRMVALIGNRGMAGSGEWEYRLDILQIDPARAEAAHVTTVLDTDTPFYPAWHPDSHVIAVTTSQGVALYPVESAPVASEADPIALVPGVRAVALAWSPDGTRLAGSHEDGTIRIWDLALMAR